MLTDVLVTAPTGSGGTGVIGVPAEPLPCADLAVRPPARAGGAVPAVPVPTVAVSTVAVPTVAAPTRPIVADRAVRPTGARRTATGRRHIGDPMTPQFDLTGTTLGIHLRGRPTS